MLQTKTFPVKHISFGELQDLERLKVIPALNTLAIVCPCDEGGICITRNAIRGHRFKKGQNH